MQSWQDHKDRARGEWAFAMGHVTQNTGSWHVFWAGGAGFSSVLQMDTLAGGETGPHGACQDGGGPVHGSPQGRVHWPRMGHGRGGFPF